jgi:hypothetical protein
LALRDAEDHEAHRLAVMTFPTGFLPSAAAFENRSSRLWVAVRSASNEL